MLQSTRGKFASVLRTVLIMQTISSVASLIESMCSGTGYYLIDKKNDGLRGLRTIGWDRLYPVNADWTHSFWGASATTEQSRNNNPTDFKINFVKDVNTGDVLNGYLHLEITRPDKIYFHYLVVWAVTENYEVYGNFVYSPDISFSCKDSKVKGYTLFTESYIPCSALPIDSATVPDSFVYADLAIIRDSEKNFKMAKVHDNADKRISAVSLLWRTSPQSYCDRPQKFRFMIITSGIRFWENKWAGNWVYTTKPTTPNMAFVEWGHTANVSRWFHPSYYGYPSRVEPSTMPLACGQSVPDEGGSWIFTTTTSTLFPEWFNQNWNYGKPFEDNVAVIKRSTCMANVPYVGESLYAGRCIEGVHGPQCSSNCRYVDAKPSTIDMGCRGQNSPVGDTFFSKQDDYKTYMDKWLARLKGSCECGIAKTRATEELEDREENPNIPEECLRIDKLEKEEQTRGGICIYNTVGKLVYGVRQWHGVTSLCVTLIITPISLFIARYNKGEMMLKEGHVPVKTWYITHVLMVFPAIWMYASGLATISRQTDVLGYSYTQSAKLHRTIGLATFAIIPFQFITGLLRPMNLTLRRIMIFIHWVGGIAMHVFELVLCILSSQIPASPTSSSSILNPNFGKLITSTVSILIIGWFVFSVLFHIFITIRIKCRDYKSGMGSRAVFPIIIPLLSTANREDMGLGIYQKDIWFQRGALLIYGLVSCITFSVSVVSLYQALHDHLYYGFGEMTCTHQLDGSLRNPSGSDSTCSQIDS